jgi:hypothetical protein
MTVLWLAVLLGAEPDAMAALAGDYAVHVEDTWDEGIADDTTRAQVVFQSGLHEGDITYDLLELRLGRDGDERLPARWRIFRTAQDLRFAWVWDDRYAPQPVQLESAVIVAGGLASFSAAPYGSTQVTMSMTPEGFTYTTRGRACLFRYPHGCLIPLPWKTTREDVRAKRL